MVMVYVRPRRDVGTQACTRGPRGVNLRGHLQTYVRWGKIRGAIWPKGREKSRTVVKDAASVLVVDAMFTPRDYGTCLQGSPNRRPMRQRASQPLARS